MGILIEWTLKNRFHYEELVNSTQDMRLLKSSYDCGIEPPGTIRHGVSNWLVLNNTLHDWNIRVEERSKNLNLIQYQYSNDNDGLYLANLQKHYFLRITNAAIEHNMLKC